MTCVVLCSSAERDFQPVRTPVEINIHEFDKKFLKTSFLNVTIVYKPVAEVQRHW